MLMPLPPDQVIKRVERLEFIKRNCSNSPCSLPLPPYLDLWQIGHACSYQIAFTCQCGAVYDLRAAANGLVCWVMEGT